MIDLHNHILHGLDDGAADADESLAMAREAVAEGITHIVATPHHRNGRFDNPPDVVRREVMALNDLLLQHGIPLTIAMGQEIRMYDGLLDDCQTGGLLTLNGSPYMLIEFPSHKVPEGAADLFYELSLLGITPIIAHPERNRELARHPERLVELIRQGALSQITSHSINGLFGQEIKKLALRWCRSNLVHVVASDAHNKDRRSFGLAQAYKTIEEQLGSRYADYYRKNAACIYDGKPCELWEPEWASRKWFQFWK